MRRFRLLARADGLVSFRMELIGGDVEAFHLGFADLGGLLGRRFLPLSSSRSNAYSVASVALRPGAALRPSWTLSP
jgi:hypothetical protein